MYSSLVITAEPNLGGLSSCFKWPNSLLIRLNYLPKYLFDCLCLLSHKNVNVLKLVATNADILTCNKVNLAQKNRFLFFNCNFQSISNNNAIVANHVQLQNIKCVRLKTNHFRYLFYCLSKTFGHVDFILEDAKF